jgi:hypothetical protein
MDKKKNDVVVFWRMPVKDEVPTGTKLFIDEQNGEWTVKHGPELTAVQLVLGCGHDTRLRKAVTLASKPWLSVSFGEPYDQTVSCWCKISDLQEVLTSMDKFIRSVRGIKDRLTVIDVEAA